GPRAPAHAPAAPLDVPLLVSEPNRDLEVLADARADVITVHQEAVTHLPPTDHRIKEIGCKAGVALNPATPLVTIEEIAPDLDLLLVMSVDPGFAGQSYIPATTDKLRRARALLQGTGSRALIEVDGGVTPQNARAVADAGADVLVAASALFHGDVHANVEAFRRSQMRIV